MDFSKPSDTRRRFLRGGVIGLLCAICELGCGTSPTDSARTSPSRTKSRLNVVCTTGMVADLVRHVGGSDIDLHQLMGAGVDPHLHKTSPGDVALLSQADVIFYSGLHLEGKMTDVFSHLSRRKKTVPIAESLPHDVLLRLDGTLHDPHLWFDVSLWSQTLEVITRTLVEAAPEHADAFRQRSKSYTAELQALHAECQTELGKLPAAQRVLITAHDAFQYLGRAYHLEVKAIQGISTESEAGVKQINELVKFIVERKIKAVFVESTVSPRAVQALIEGCARSNQTVRIGGELFSDAMGEPGTAEGTYVGMVRHNLHTIVEALK